MFTVIIAEQKMIDLFNEYDVFLSPMADKKNYALCPWNREGESISEMLPDLYSIIEYRDEWNAIVVSEDGLEQVNPFDHTQYKDIDIYEDGALNWNKITERRQNRYACYEKAINDPLTRLTSALCTIPKFNSVIEDNETYSKIVSGEIKFSEYLITRQLEVLNLSEAAGILDTLRRKMLLQYVSEEQTDALIECVRTGDARGITNLISEDKIVDFVGFIGDYDPIFTDPEYLECIVENTYKAKLFAAIEKRFTLKDKIPGEVICVARRTYDYRNYEQNVKWQGKDESDYSSFADFNMYPEKLRYIVFDIIENSNRQYRFDQMRMVCFLLMLATNPIPAGAVNANRVYRANIEFNIDAVKKTCSAYLSKLRATNLHINKIARDMKADEVTGIDNATSQKLFEENIDVPVTMDTTFPVSDLYADYSRIGLSTDCPESEYHAWYNQSRQITKKFNRYLREPKRALKATVDTEIDGKSSIDDERILCLTERQREDVEYNLLDEEEKMIDTVTPALFNNREYVEMIDEADKEIREKIEQRMTRKKTLITALIAVCGFLFGFIPLIITDVNTMGSFTVSLTITGIAVGILVLIGFIFLLVVRRKLINRFIHFNKVMGGILNNINEGLTAFSKYLSHACNVMRGFSVLNYSEKCRISQQTIIAKHVYDIGKKVDAFSELFYGYIDLSTVRAGDIEPYYHDYSVLCDYEYDIPYELCKTTVEFLQVGNVIEVPIDYVKSVSLTREELYD